MTGSWRLLLPVSHKSQYVTHLRSKLFNRLVGLAQAPLIFTFGDSTASAFYSACLFRKVTCFERFEFEFGKKL